ncbi:hypothetical protein [Azonexus hydrophilus]|uniref:hypothetical protein n=1 Tax=Azonexus hydrophilus TaxID=418702 RepID=UPI001FE122CD|nr:hypothetical protein [Azonexus hydrophilus]
MMGIKKHVATWLVFAVLATGTTTGMASGLKILAFDDNSCRAWRQGAEDVELRTAHVAWARGFLSGHNYANPRQQVTDVSVATVERNIEQFCRRNPDGLFIDGVYRMSDSMSGRNAPIKK